MRNIESIPLLESKEAIPKKEDVEEGSLERKFTVGSTISKHNEDIQQSDALLKKISTTQQEHEEMPHEENHILRQLDAIHAQTVQVKAEKIKRIATNITDFVPVIGSIKMIMEGWRGKQYGTENEIKGLGRIVHTASGVVFLALDLTGIGAIASELGKGVIKIGERATVRTLEETLARELLAKEGTKLVARGETRITRKEKIERSV